MFIFNQMSSTFLLNPGHRVVTGSQARDRREVQQRFLAEDSNQLHPRRGNDGNDGNWMKNWKVVWFQLLFAKTRLSNSLQVHKFLNRGD